MAKQVIVTIGREFGSGGHEIARKIAAKLDIKLYDKNILDEIAEQKNMESGEVRKLDEKPRGWFGSRRVRGHTNSLQDHIAKMQFDYIKEKSESGESFVVVGRCAEHVLKDHNSVISIFVLADEDVKIERLKRTDGMDEKEAVREMLRRDGIRKAYHNSHTVSKWRHPETYDLCINSSRLGIDGTVDALIDYINRRIEEMD